MRLIDVNGAPHVLTEFQVKIMITIGWVTFLAAWLMNLLNYTVHPSSVNYSPKEKMFIYIFGKKYNLCCILCRSRCCRKGKVNLLLFTCYMYVCIFSIHRQWERFCVGRRYRSGSWTDWMMLKRNYSSGYCKYCKYVLYTVGKSFYWRSMIMIEQPGSNKGKVKSEKQLLQKLPLTDGHECW